MLHDKYRTELQISESPRNEPSNLAVELAADNVSALDGASVTPIKASIGSRISGYWFDGKSISDDFRAAMRHLLHNRGLVVFEPGTVTAENFTKFGGFLGEFFHYAGPHTPRAPENPDATVISAGKDAHLRNHVWHADGGFRADAPAFTALFGKAIPKNGGDTMYSNTAYVYEMLDPLFAQYLESLNVIQSPDATGHITDRYLDPEEAAQARLRMPPFEMPLIRTHPESGRKWVAVNECLCLLHQGRQPCAQPKYSWHPVRYDQVAGSYLPLRMGRRHLSCLGQPRRAAPRGKGLRERCDAASVSLHHDSVRQI